MIVSFLIHFLWWICWHLLEKILRLVLCTCMFIRRLLNNNYIIMHNYDSHYINFGGVVFINFSNFAIWATSSPTHFLWKKSWRRFWLSSAYSVFSFTQWRMIPVPAVPSALRRRTERKPASASRLMKES